LLNCTCVKMLSVCIQILLCSCYPHYCHVLPFLSECGSYIQMKDLKQWRSQESYQRGARLQHQHEPAPSDSRRARSRRLARSRGSHRGSDDRDQPSSSLACRVAARRPPRPRAARQQEQATAAFRNSLPLLFLDQMPGPWTPRLLGGLLKTRTTRPT